MADTKISNLTSYTPPISTDVMPIVDVTTSTTKKITIANLASYLASLAQTLTNKILSDSTSYFGNVSDTTKKLVFSLGGATTAKTMTIASSHTVDRTLTLPDATDTLVGKATTDTLTNKTLTSPSIATPTITSVWNFGAHTAYFTETDNGNSGTADTIDWTLSNKQKSTLTGNCTFTFTAPSGPCSLVLKLVQDATGSRTVTWPAAVHWSGGTAPTLTTTASKVDIITFYYDGSTYFGNSSLNYTA
jgi:hypothetical protein